MKALPTTFPLSAASPFLTRFSPLSHPSPLFLPFQGRPYIDWHSTSTMALKSLALALVGLLLCTSTAAATDGEALEARFTEQIVLIVAIGFGWGWVRGVRFGEGCGEASGSSHRLTRAHKHP